MSELSVLLSRFATKWISKHPEAETRITKGHALALAGHASPWDNRSWRVLSSDKSRTYWVEVNSGYTSCTCPDFEKRKIRCCHIWSCALLTRVAEEIAPAPSSCSLSLRTRKQPVITKKLRASSP